MTTVDEVRAAVSDYGRLCSEAEAETWDDLSEYREFIADSERRLRVALVRDGGSYRHGRYFYFLWEPPAYFAREHADRYMVCRVPVASYRPSTYGRWYRDFADLA